MNDKIYILFFFFFLILLLYYSYDATLAFDFNNTLLFEERLDLLVDFSVLNKNIYI